MSRVRELLESETSAYVADGCVAVVAILLGAVWALVCDAMGYPLRATLAGVAPFGALAAWALRGALWHWRQP